MQTSHTRLQLAEYQDVPLHWGSASTGCLYHQLLCRCRHAYINSGAAVGCGNPPSEHAGHFWPKSAASWRSDKANRSSGGPCRWMSDLQDAWRGGNDGLQRQQTDKPFEDCCCCCRLPGGRSSWPAPLCLENCEFHGIIMWASALANTFSYRQVSAKRM